jgi:MFS family permease
MNKGILASLNKEQKEAIGLLQIGTFLEYFDLMLYVHMAVLLNELFFPKTDAHTAALLTAFAFCSTYVLRPVGALIFGWIGDNIGRKATVIITTTMMAISCIIMANLPTYAQIGIAASWVVTGCRITQGLSSMGEIIGAQIYVTEITKPPYQYPAVSFIAVASAVGAVSALGVASLVTHCELNWRIAFWIGACIAVVGSIARTRLRETPEFLAQKIRKDMNLSHKEGNYYYPNVTKKTLLSFFFIYCGWPLSFYLVFMYFNPKLTALLGYTPEDIILHNFKLSIVFLLTFVALALLSWKIHPLKIIKIRGTLSLILTLFLPWLIHNCSTANHFFLLQTTLLILSLASTPTESILVRAVPVLRRFTAASMIYALSRALIYVITSFSLVYLTSYWGDYGLLIIMLPITVGFLWGVRHFETLEKRQEKNIVFEGKGDGKASGIYTPS